VADNWICPVCGASFLARIYRKSLQGKVTLPPQDDMRVLAYRCQNGHIWIAGDEVADGDNRSKSAA
jgi:hypothetical protein